MSNLQTLQNLVQINIGGRDDASGTVLSDTASCKQVLAPATTGVTIVNSKGGATYNWLSIQSGFNYNDGSGYTYTIYRS